MSVDVYVHGPEVAKMRTRVAALFSGLLCIALFSGCGGDPPKTELDAARSALQDAKSAGAELFAKTDLSAAQSAFEAAESKYKAEEGNLFKDWDTVKPLISDAKGKADRAKSAAVAAKSKAKGAAESAIASAAAAVQSARETLGGAPSGKGTEGDIEQLGSQLDGADADLSAARSSVSKDDFDGATSKANGAKTKAESVASGVDQAVAKYNDLVEKNTPWYMKM